MQRKDPSKMFGFKLGKNSFDTINSSCLRPFRLEFGVKLLHFYVF